MHLSVSGEHVLIQEVIIKCERPGFDILRGHELFSGKEGVNQLK